MNALRNNIAASITAVVIAVSSLTQQRTASAQVQLGNNPYSPYTPTLPNASPDATNYLDFPLSRLKQVVPPLKGLDYESSQDQLPTILAGIARTIANVLPKLPDLISREDIYHFQSAGDPLSGGGQINAQRWTREFRYLILCHHTSNDSVWIEESRVDRKGRPIDLSGPISTPRGFGFAYQWLLFSAANQPEFRFRYLGQQQKDGKKTFVVAFAQIPTKVSTPGNFQSNDKAIPFFYQGVLWIDQSTYEIVLLRTDLLAPIPRIQLYKLTTEVHFSSVQIQDFNAIFWLPREVDIATEQGAATIEENHRYSDYHLFHASAKIVP